MDKFKHFINKNKMIIIPVIIIMLFAFMKLFINKPQEEIKLTLTTSKTEYKVGEIIDYKVTHSPPDAKIYEVKLYYSFYTELDKDMTTIRAKKRGTFDLYAAVLDKNGDQVVLSNKIKIRITDNPVSLSASYTGSTLEGTEINDDSSLVVKVTYESGNEETVTDWTITNPSNLISGQTSSFNIKYENVECNLDITGTKAVTLGEKNALNKALRYLQTMPFSYTGLIKQLNYEGYSDSEAMYAVDNCGADWNLQAEKMAKNYLDVMPFSRQELISQLIYEGFTQEQAEHGVASVGY